MPYTHPNKSRTYLPDFTDFTHPNVTFRIDRRSGNRSHGVSIISAMLLLTYGATDLFSRTWDWRIYTTDNSLLGDNFVTAVGIDSSGRQWTGTMSAGLCMIDGYEWSAFNRSNSALPSDTIISILVHPDGTCWFGTHGGGLVSYRDDRWETFNTENSGLLSNKISGNAFILGRDSSLWVGTWGGGVSRYHNAEWTTYDTGNSPLPNQVVWTACIDSSDALWFGTLNGLARYANESWRVYTTDNSDIPLNDIAALCVDKDGSLWLGTWGAGIARFDGTNWTRFDVSNSPLPNDFVEALTFDSFGRLWIGSWGGGVAVYDGADWTILDSSNTDLPGNNIRMILHDERESKMWICCQGGLAVCDYREFPAVVRATDRKGGLAVIGADRAADPILQMTLPQPGHVSVTMFGLTGERVATLTDNLLSEGEHLLPIPETAPDGLYYCVMSLDGVHVTTTPVLVVR